MTDPDRTSDGKAESPDPDSTWAFDAGETMAEELVRVLEAYMADLQAGRAPDRDQLLADHLPGRHALRAGHRQAAVRGGDGARGDLADPERRAGHTPPARPSLQYLRYQNFLPKHIRDADRDGRFAIGRGQGILAGDEVGLLLGHVGQDDVEGLATVGRVDHHAIDHRPPVVDLGLQNARLRREPLDVLTL